MKKTLILTVSLAICLNGCGAILNGSSKSIDVQCSPQGTTLSGNPDIGEYQCPTTLKLERKHSYVLTFSKEGYNSSKVQIKKGAQAGIIVLDVLLTGLIGVVIDAATGSWNNLKPDQVSVSLEKTDLGVAGPDRIDISLNNSNGDPNSFSLETSEPVVVHVEKVD